MIGDDSGYKLSPDFTQTFNLSGKEKATNKSIVEGDVNTNISWKPMMAGGAPTAFYQSISRKKDTTAKTVRNENTESNHDVIKNIDKILARLDDLENRKSENAQTEVVLFVMSGLFIMFSMDLLVRNARR